MLIEQHALVAAELERSPGRSVRSRFIRVTHNKGDAWPSTATRGTPFCLVGRLVIRKYGAHAEPGEHKVCGLPSVSSHISDMQLVYLSHLRIAIGNHVFGWVPPSVP